jgi:hypothetical protein
MEDFKMIAVPPETHQAIKDLAIETGQSIGETIDMLLEVYSGNENMNTSQIDNQETAKPSNAEYDDSQTVEDFKNLME